jgi:hypothetical protein
VAESLGLHDFYQNSLWGYCEGNNDRPDQVTFCSKPAAMYTFDPVDIFSRELFAGQSVTVPQSVQDDRDRLHTASHWMFALYIVGVILAFITALAGLMALCTLFGSCVATFASLMAFIFIAAATLLAQIIYVIYRNAINDTITQLNVTANLGTAIFAFSWTATISALVAFLGFLIGICCGTGGRREYAREKRY